MLRRRPDSGVVERPLRTGSSNPWVVLIVLCLGFFMILLDTSIVNIAIPSIIDGLHASLDQILWVLNAYILVYAVLLITAGRLGDMFGQRRLFIFGLALFTVASAFCGLAQDTNQLVAARVVQGIGGALLSPQTLAMVLSIFPPDRRGTAFGVWSAVAGIGAVAGPTLGGFIVTSISWRWIFYVNVPIGIITLIAAFFLLPDRRFNRGHHLDIVGVLLASLGLFALVYGLIEGQRFGWGVIVGAITIPEVLAGGVLLLVAVPFWEARQAEPLVPLSLFRIRNFAIMNWIRVVVGFAMFGLILPITIYFQSVLGMSALVAGLAIAPVSLGSAILSPLVGRLVDKFGGKYILLAGLLLYAAGMGGVAWDASASATWRTFLLPLSVAGVGLGAVFPPMTTMAMRDVAASMGGAASGILNTTRQLGSAIGNATVGAILQFELATTLHSQAEAYASQAPAGLRAAFIAAFSKLASAGLDVGPGQNGGVQLPAGVAPQTAARLQQLVHDVFVNAFVSAMRPTLIVPIAVLLLGMVSCLAIERRKRTPLAVEAVPEESLAVAG